MFPWQKWIRSRKGNGNFIFTESIHLVACVCAKSSRFKIYIIMYCCCAGIRRYEFAQNARNIQTTAQTKRKRKLRIAYDAFAAYITWRWWWLATFGNCMRRIAPRLLFSCCLNKAFLLFWGWADWMKCARLDYSMCVCLLLTAYVCMRRMCKRTQFFHW